MRYAWHVACMWERRNAYSVLVGRPEGRRPLGKSRHRWEDNIKMELQELGLKGMDWNDLAQDRDRWQALANVVMNLQVLQNGHFLANQRPVSFSRRNMPNGVSYLVS